MTVPGELVTRQGFQQGLTFFCVLAGLLLPLALWWVGGRRSWPAPLRRARALAYGSLPWLVWILWYVYLAVMDRWGMDRLISLALSALILMAVGGGVGWGLGYMELKFAPGSSGPRRRPRARRKSLPRRAPAQAKSRRRTQ